MLETPATLGIFKDLRALGEDISNNCDRYQTRFLLIHNESLPRVLEPVCSPLVTSLGSSKMAKVMKAGSTIAAATPTVRGPLSSATTSTETTCLRSSGKSVTGQ